MYAVSSGNIELVRLMIKYFFKKNTFHNYFQRNGADPDIICDGFSAVQIAANKRDAKLLALVEERSSYPVTKSYLSIGVISFLFLS